MTADDPTERATAAEVAVRLTRRPAAELVADAGGSTASRWRRNRHRATTRRRPAGEPRSATPRRSATRGPRVGERRAATLVFALLLAGAGAGAVLSWPVALGGSPAVPSPAVSTAGLYDADPP